MNRFFSCCHTIGMKNEDLFTHEDLLDEINKLKILRTLQCIRAISEGHEGYIYDGPERPFGFGSQFEFGMQPPIVNSVTVKVQKSAKRRSLSLFQGVLNDDVEPDGPVSPVIKNKTTEEHPPEEKKPDEEISEEKRKPEVVEK